MARDFLQTMEAVDVRKYFPSVTTPDPPQVQPPEELRGMKGVNRE